jgi:hypothetical protein
MALAALWFSCGLSTGNTLPAGAKCCFSAGSSLHPDFSSYTVTFRQVDTNGVHPRFNAILNNTATEI